jgi:thymidylate kinase
MQSGAEAKAAMQSEPEAKAAMQSGAETEAAMQSETEAKAAMQSEPETEAARQSEPEAEAAMQSEPETKAARQSGAEAKAARQSEPETEAARQSGPEAEAARQSGPETEAARQSGAEAKAARQSEQVLARRHQHRRVLEALTAAGIRHALLRGDPGSGDDLDLVVHPADVGWTGRVLASAGLRPAPSEHHWPHLLFVGRHDGVDVVVDVVDRLVIRTALLGGREAVAQLVEDAAPDAEGVRRLAAEDEAWVRLVHGVLKGIPLDATRTTVEALGDGAVVARALDRALGTGTAAKTRAALAQGSGAEVVELLQPLSRQPWPKADRIRRALALWRGRLPAGAPGGARVVLLGPDGAGKSTLSDGLRRTLPLPVHEIYMGVFRMDSWQRITRLIPGFGLISRLSRLWWRCAKAGYFCRRGHVVVFDRYTYDAGLRPGKRGLRARMSYFVLERALPDPDVVLLLDCPGEVMFARKHEHDVETLEERRGWYRDLAADLPNAVVLDATLPSEQVLEGARAAAWRALQPS